MILEIVLIIIFGIIAIAMDFLIQEIFECKKYSIYSSVFYVYGFTVGLIISFTGR